MKPLLWLLGLLPRALLALQLKLASHDAHREEYLADALAARVAGTAAVVELHERLLFESVLELAIQRAARADQAAGEDVFELLRDGIEAIPDREVERRRRVARFEGPMLEDPHPLRRRESRCSRLGRWRRVPFPSPTMRVVRSTTSCARCEPTVTGASSRRIDRDCTGSDFNAVAGA